MKVSVFGLGYIGCVSAACLARDGHSVIGVDVNPLKVELINAGRSPIVERGIDELIATAVKNELLRATADAAEAVADSDVSLVCVGTPSTHNGSPDLAYITRACRQIGEALASKRRHHVVAIRSTTLPGTIEQTIVPTLEMSSGKRSGRHFGVAANPEFLRAGTSIDDFSHPPFTLIGSADTYASLPLQRLYVDIDAPLLTVGIREAEMVKYACNGFHALKVSFANEIGNLAYALGVDSDVVMDVFCKDTKLNLSPCYLKPGFAFGGSCLPKDLRALTHRAKQLDLEVPVLNSILVSNRQQVERAVATVLATGRKNVGVLGLSFKPGTDDLRESPMVSLIETLIGKGLKVSVYDRDVELARLFGANREYIEREIPHISSLMDSNLNHVVECSDVIIVAKKEDGLQTIVEKLANDQVIIDLERSFEIADASLRLSPELPQRT